MSNLSQKKCIPCSGSVSALQGADLDNYLKMLDGWEIIDEHHLEKEYNFPNFRQALSFTNLVGEIAEREDHHPDIYLAWGKVRVTIWTHKINGLTESDFILAAKCDEEAAKK